MDKEEALKTLQEKAREYAERAEWFRSHDEKRLSEIMTVYQRMSFKFQDIIREYPKENLSEKVDELDYDFTNGIIHYRNLRLISFSELSAAALSALFECNYAIKDYLL